MTEKSGVFNFCTFLLPLMLFTVIAWFPLVIVAEAPSVSVPRDSREDPAWQRSGGWFRRGEVDLAEQARQRYERGRYRAAARTYSRMANLASRPVNAAWATMRKAEMNIAAGRLERAKEDYKNVIENWPGEINFQQAVDRLREIAETFAREPGSALWVIPVMRTQQALETYEFIVAQRPSGQQVAGDLMRLAELQLQERQVDDAMRSLQQVFNRHPGSEKAAVARIEYIKLLLEKAEEQYDSKPLLEASHREARLFLRFHPRHELADEARAMARETERRLADHYLELADFYLHPVRYNLPAARRYLRKVVDRYSETEAAEKARERLASLAENSARSVNTGGRSTGAGQDEDGGNPESSYESTSSNPVEAPRRQTAAGGEESGNSPIQLLSREQDPLPVLSTMAVRSVRNLTREPELATIVRRQLHEEIMREETVSLESSRNADILVEIRVNDFRYEATATARIRQEDDIPDTLSSHATTLYTAYLEMEYRILDPQGRGLVDWQSLRGGADFPQMPDMAMAREAAVRQASTDAAAKLVQGIVESW